jgi:DNA-binding transcriptional LysR family regulator
MELRQLEYFVAVAGEMNFSRAAQRVHVVQSALSTSVGKLEKELGVELFDRTKQQIRITPAGELFREHALRVIQAARLAKDSMTGYRGELTGTVDLGLSSPSENLTCRGCWESSTDAIRKFGFACGRVKPGR